MSNPFPSDLKIVQSIWIGNLFTTGSIEIVVSNFEFVYIHDKFSFFVFFLLHSCCCINVPKIIIRKFIFSHSNGHLGLWKPGFAKNLFSAPPPQKK